MAGPKASFGRPEGPAEPAKAAGIAPRLEPAGRRRQASARGRDPNGVARGFGPERLRQSGKASGPPSKCCFDGTLGPAPCEGRPEGLRPRCEPGTGRLRPAGSAQGRGKAGFQSCRTRPEGDRREASRPLPRPNGGRTGREPRSGTREREGPRPTRSRSRPARDGLATQRRQSRLGQVGAGGDTGPHYDSWLFLPGASVSRASLPGPQAFFFEEGTKARSDPRCPDLQAALSGLRALRAAGGFVPSCLLFKRGPHGAGIGPLIRFAIVS